MTYLHTGECQIRTPHIETHEEAVEQFIPEEAQKTADNMQDMD